MIAAFVGGTLNDLEEEVDDNSILVFNGQEVYQRDFNSKHNEFKYIGWIKEKKE